MPKHNHCPHCQHEHFEKNGSRILQSVGRIQRYRCKACKRTWTDRTKTGMHGLRTSPEKIGSALHARTEGVGLRATGRLIGVDHHTVSFWEQRLAETEDSEERSFLEQLPTEFVRIVEGDCLYTRVHHNRPASQSPGWTTMTLERETRVMLALEPGDANRIKTAVRQTCQAVPGGLHFVSDGDPRFGKALLTMRGEPYFTGLRGRPARVMKQGSEAVMKIKGSQSSKQKGARVRPVRAHPLMIQLEDALVHANHCEATNAMLRRRCSAFKRRTNQYAKNSAGLRRVCVVQRLVHNHVRPHWGLSGGRTPAMAAGWCDRALSFAELLMR